MERVLNLGIPIPDPEKQALITDVVMGKLDVRETADTLPEVESFIEDGEAGAFLDAGGELAFDDHEPMEVGG